MGAGSNFVSAEYQNEEAAQEAEWMEKSFSVPFTVRVDGLTASIIDGLASRFGTNRNAIIREMLKQNAIEAMEELKPGDRLRVAEAGDKAYQEFLAKNPDIQASPGAVLRMAEVFNRTDEARVNKKQEVAA